MMIMRLTVYVFECLMVIGPRLFARCELLCGRGFTHMCGGHLQVF